MLRYIHKISNKKLNEKRSKVMRKTTLAIYMWDNGWKYYGSTPNSNQAINIIEELKKKGIEAKTVLRYL